MRAVHGLYYAYLLRCADGSYYAGYTVDPIRRLLAHGRGRASRYTRGRGPHTFAALWQCPDRPSALRLEWLLKRLPHAGKQRLAMGRHLWQEVSEADRVGAQRRRPPRVRAEAHRRHASKGPARPARAAGCAHGRRDVVLICKG